MKSLVDFIWTQFEHMIKASNMIVLNIPGHIVDIIGDSGVNSIARSFRFVVLHIIQTHQVQRLIYDSEFIGAPTQRAMNPVTGMHRIVPANFHLGHEYIIKGGSEPKHQVAKKEKTPRPPNAFILYRQRHHPLLRAKYPALHNNQICQ